MPLDLGKQEDHRILNVEIPVSFSEIGKGVGYGATKAIIFAVSLFGSDAVGINIVGKLLIRMLNENSVSVCLISAAIILRISAKVNEFDDVWVVNIGPADQVSMTGLHGLF